MAGSGYRGMELRVLVFCLVLAQASGCCGGAKDKVAVIGHIDYVEPQYYGPITKGELQTNLNNDEATLSELGKDIDHLRASDSYLFSMFARPGPQGPPGPPGIPGTAGAAGVPGMAGLTGPAGRPWGAVLHPEILENQRALREQQQETEVKAGALKDKLRRVGELRRRLKQTVHRARRFHNRNASLQNA